MIFWKENNVEISYDQLLSEIKSNESIHNLSGLNYFIKILKSLLKGQSFNSVDEILNYLKVNSSSLKFEISTSGTTSEQKKIQVKLSNCIRYVKTGDRDVKKIWGLGYPVGSFASTQVFFQSLFNSECIIYLFEQDFNSIVKIINQNKVTNLCCTPTFLSMLLINSQLENDSVKKLSTGGEKIQNSLIKNFRKVFINAEYANIYATTETGSLLYSKSEYFSIPPRYRKKLKIENNTLHVHKSMLNDSPKIKLSNEWYDTNDIVQYIDSDQFKFIARKNGFINTGGYRISPSEIEDIIINIPGVLDAHVYGRPNSMLGTILCADILSKNLDVKDIKSHLKSIIEKHKMPQIVKIVDSFENTAKGKKQVIL
jgi:acyl-coenzyme A synthetase/AMP-(fatty) acid ligase